MLRNFSKGADLPERVVDALVGTLVEREVGPQTILSEIDTPARCVYFIGSGSARSYYLQEGREVTYWIAMEGDIAGSVSSYLTGSASSKAVATIEACVLWEIHQERMARLARSYPEIAVLIQDLLSEAIVRLEARLDALLFHSAKERYATLLQERPDIVRRVPLGIIASYLGMSQETLSRVRGF